MTRLGRALTWVAGVVGFAGAALFFSACGASGVSISASPSPVPCSEAGADTSSSQLRSELGSLWRSRAFLVSQLMSRGASGDSAAADALMTNSAEIASVIGQGFGETQANIAESQLVKNSDLLVAYFSELSGTAHPALSPDRAGPGAEKALAKLEAGIVEVSDFLWLLTSAPRMVLRGLMTEQVRLVTEGQSERAIGLGTEIGGLLASAFHRRVPEKYPASPETPAATDRSRREADADAAIYETFRTGVSDSLRARLNPGVYQVVASALQAKAEGDDRLAYSFLEQATTQLRSDPALPAACEEGTR